MNHFQQMLVRLVTATVALIYLNMSISSNSGLKKVEMFSQNTFKNTGSGFLCLGFNKRCAGVIIDEEDGEVEEAEEDEEDGEAEEDSRFLQKPKSSGVFNRNNDPDFSHVVNTIFPMDSIISYNETNRSTTEIVARYASFSPILSHEIVGNYAFVAGSACSDIETHLHPEYKDKILIVQRGKCSFVKKLYHIVSARLDPLAVIVANNVPHSGLITMFSRSVDRDDDLSFPVLFMSLEDYQDIQNIEKPNIELSIRTASFDGFIGLVLSMAVSPPLVILICFLIIRGTQKLNRRRRNKKNQKFVKSLPVHIYNRTHLIPTNYFYEYLIQTNQTHSIPSVQSSTDDISTPHESFVESPSEFVMGGMDLYSLTNLLILFADRDFYATRKCSICLGKYVPLKSRVLVLQCKHVYHEKCLSNWLINFKKTCPLCNKAFSVENMSTLVENSQTDYGTFPLDMERQSQMERQSEMGRQSVMERQSDIGRGSDLERQCSNIAVRSFQISSIMSENDQLLHPLQVSNEPLVTSSMSPTSYVSADSHLLDQHISNSSSSFVTTKTQQSTVSSRESLPSSYHTSASVLSHHEDTQSHESSHSTLQF